VFLETYSNSNLGAFSYPSHELGLSLVKIVIKADRILSPFDLRVGMIVKKITFSFEKTLSPSIHKYDNVFIHSGLSAE
jgi:hypothetical protein